MEAKPPVRYVGMHTLLEKAAARIAAGTAPLENAAEAVELARLPRSENPDIFACAALARARYAGPVFTCAIINAKSGRCAENCAFCAQSSFHHTDAPVYGLVGTDVLLKHAEEMAAHGVKRFGIVTSGTTVSDRDLDSLCESARILRDRVNIALCGSLGILTKEKLRRLKEAGFTSIHHNLETARSHFASICTTHDYDQDIATLRDARDAGFRVCSCGIFGLGETWEQRVELLETEKECGVDSLPVNLLDPVPGTRMEHQKLLEPWEALRCVALARLVSPEKDVILCGGRLPTLGDGSSWALAAGANGIMTGNYLTTKGCGYDDDDAMFRFLGVRG